MNIRTLSTLLIPVLAGAAAVAQDSDLDRIDPDMAIAKPDSDLVWYDALDIGLEGQGWQDLARPYDRLPKSAEGVVRKSVWGLSRHSAGISVRFLSNSDTIAATWSLRRSMLAMDHMPATGVSGLDLYVRDGEQWRWVATGRPREQEGNTATLVTGLPHGVHEYQLYLPLYNGTKSLQIGIEPGKTIARAPDYPDEKSRPILFWGTSILQGGCASRTGMAYPSIIGRNLDRPTINLGFSGNGKMDPEIVDMIAKLDPSMYVIDCVPNMNPESVAERTGPLVRKLRAAHPDIPVVLVESIVYQNGWFVAASEDRYQNNNFALRREFDKLIDSGITNLHYIPGDNLLGDDELGTVDGVHPTDLGFLRMAEVIGTVLQAIFDEQ